MSKQKRICEPEGGFLQAFDSRSFALGGAQSHRFVPVPLADSSQSRFSQQQQQLLLQQQALAQRRLPLPVPPPFMYGEAPLMNPEP